MVNSAQELMHMPQMFEHLLCAGLVLDLRPVQKDINPEAVIEGLIRNLRL